MSTIYLVEPGPTGGPGVMGALILIDALRRDGHRVVHVRMRDGDAEGQAVMVASGSIDVVDASLLPRPDAWFVSCLYVRQWVHLVDLLERAGVPLLAADRDDRHPLVAFGGAVSITPEPMAPFADVLALGDGEVTGVALARWAAHGRAVAMREARGRPGYYVPLLDAPPTSFSRVEAPLVPVAVEPGERGSPTIELARGCKSKCAFCPIGWSGGSYREATPEQIRPLLDRHRGRPVNLFAPDYSSVSWSLDADAAMDAASCTPRGRDARMDATDRALIRGAAVREYSFGVEGLSERLRRAIGKPLDTERIVRTMAALSNVGTIKWYLIFALPGEADADRAEFRALLAEVRRVYAGRLDLTLTHFQSVPHTPLQWASNHFDDDAYAWVMDLRAWLADADRANGSDGRGRWMCSQPKGRETHEHDAWLQRGDRSLAGYLLDRRRGAVASGRWREGAARHGAPDVARTLDAIPPDVVTPWSHVDVGQPIERVRRGWDAYQRAMLAPTREAVSVSGLAPGIERAPRPDVAPTLSAWQPSLLAPRRR